MFSQAMMAALRILAFRAGPQDFPFSPQLMQMLAPLAMGANYLVFIQVLPWGMSAAMAFAMVGGMGMVTATLLRSRGLSARFVQTFSALLATNALLTLMLVPVFIQIAPKLMELANNPDLMGKPDQLDMPQGPVFLMNLFNIWNFAVTAVIFRHAANMAMWSSLLIAILAALVMAFMVVVFGSLAGAIFGVPQ